MNEEEYLKKVRKALRTIERKKRYEIILELRSEIDERLENGEEIKNILRDMPSPQELKREYTKIYGPSLIIKFLIIIIPAIISIFTTSVIPFTSTVFYGAPAFLILLGLLIFYVSLNFGIKLGLFSSTLSGILRFIIIYLTSLYTPLQEGTLLSEGITSLIIFIIPFFGKNKK